MTYGMSTLHRDPHIDEALRTTFRTHPYYSSIIIKLRIVADPNVPTMATSASWVTHYNPAAVAGWGRDETAAVLVHELEHLLRDHAGRCGDRDPKGWNIAADAEINQRLSGLPEGAIYPSTLGLPDGRPAEVYYGASGQGQPQPDDGPGDGAGQPGDGPGDGAGQPGDGPSCGSSAGGPVQPHEAGDAKAPGAGAANGGDDARREAAEEILSGHYGVDPGDDLREWAEITMDIDRSAWYSALASAVGTTLSSYGAPTRWRWPGRRDMRDVGGAMLPRWTGERPSCAVVIDTSSSVSEFDLGMARAAGHFVARMADTTFYGCNTLATKYGSALPERIIGGGGTDLRNGIEMAIADGARAVVVITDCETPWATEPYAVPVIIGANVRGSVHINAGSSDYSCPPEWMVALPIVSPS